MRGIILAGGKGTRLYPITLAVSKQLLPIYDKPMIYYPLSTLIDLNIKEIAVITTRESQDSYKKLLGDGSLFGVDINYLIQDEPDGIAQSFIIAEEFIRGMRSCLILGDNIFYDLNHDRILKRIENGNENGGGNGALIFSIYHKNPSNYGVLEYGTDGRISSIVEKPENPQSNYIVPGMYFYDDSVVERAKRLKRSQRGEIEITDLNKSYLRDGLMSVYKLSKNVRWFDAGSPDDLLESSRFMKNRKSYKENPINNLSNEIK